MNKTAVITIVVLAAIVLGFFVINSINTSENTLNEEPQGTSSLNSLETDNELFTEMDTAINSLE